MSSPITAALLSIAIVQFRSSDRVPVLAGVATAGFLGRM